MRSHTQRLMVCAASFAALCMGLAGHAGDHHPVLRFAIRLLPGSRIRTNLRAERIAGSGTHRRRR